LEALNRKIEGVERKGTEKEEWLTSWKLPPASLAILTISPSPDQPEV